MKLEKVFSKLNLAFIVIQFNLSNLTWHFNILVVIQFNLSIEDG